MDKQQDDSSMKEENQQTFNQNCPNQNMQSQKEMSQCNNAEEGKSYQEQSILQEDNDPPDSRDQTWEEQSRPMAAMDSEQSLQSLNKLVKEHENISGSQLNKFNLNENMNNERDTSHPFKQADNKLDFDQIIEPKQNIDEDQDQFQDQDDVSEQNFSNDNVQEALQQDHQNDQKVLATEEFQDFSILNSRQATEKHMKSQQQSNMAPKIESSLIDSQVRMQSRVTSNATQVCNNELDNILQAYLHQELQNHPQYSKFENEICRIYDENLKGKFTTKDIIVDAFLSFIDDIFEIPKPESKKKQSTIKDER